MNHLFRYSLPIANNLQSGTVFPQDREPQRFCATVEKNHNLFRSIKGKKRCTILPNLSTLFFHGSSVRDSNMLEDTCATTVTYKISH